MSRLIFLLFGLLMLCSVLSQGPPRPRGTPPPPDHQARGRSGRLGHTVFFLARTGVPPLGQPMPPELLHAEEEEEVGHGCSEERPNCTNFFNQRFPTADGECNNRVNPSQGSTERSFKRILRAVYDDGHDALRLARNGGPLPSARRISNAVQGPLSTDTPFSHMLPFWGQFLVHDVALTLEPDGSTIECDCHDPQPHSECINIPIPRGDEQYRSDLAQRKTCFTTERSVGVANSENCDSPIREQLNEVSGYLDMGLIYGNSEEHLEAIREHGFFKRGELIAVQERFSGFGDLLPSSDFGPEITPAANAMFCPEFVKKPPLTTCRVSGEARTNENSVLQSHHTVWMRIHNVVVKQLRVLNPSWDGDRVLQVGKAIVTALNQRVTYEHFLPIIVGDTNMRRFDLELQNRGYYYGYDSSYSAGVSNSFTTAAFRMGHTLINEVFRRPNAEWDGPQGDDIRVKTSLFNVGVVTEKNSGGPNSFIRGLANDSAIRFDPTFSDDLRNFLFSNNFDPTSFGADLLSRNLQRGRDHGLPTYAQVRVFCGLPDPDNFNDLLDVMTLERLNNLRSVYGHVQDIDLFAGGISENPVEDGVIGPTFACLISYQFRDLKIGDRFWHENPPPFGSFTPAQLAAIRNIPFPRMLCEMIELNTIQPLPLRKAGPGNQRRPCSSYPEFDLSAFREPAQTEFLRDVEQSTEGTTWFPTNIRRRGRAFTISELYQWLLINRPTEVCRQVVSTRVKTVNGLEQARFRCLPGTITHSDFPPVYSENFYWTQWYTGSASPTQNDYEVTPTAQQRDCPVPYAIQAQTLEGVPAGETGDVFNRFSATQGLVCFGQDQESGTCNSYRIRFLCKY